MIGRLQDQPSDHDQTVDDIVKQDDNVCRPEIHMVKSVKSVDTLLLGSSARASRFERSKKERISIDHRFPTHQLPVDSNELRNSTSTDLIFSSVCRQSKSLFSRRKTVGGEMGCSFSGLNALYDSASGGGDVWINENRFRIVRQIGEDGLAFVYLVKEIVSNAPGGSGSGLAAKIGKNQSHVSDDGLYALKKVAIQSEQQLELVRQEISVSSLFSHPNLLPLLDHAIVPVKDTKDGLTNYEAFLLFPVHLDGTLLDRAKSMQSKKEFFPTITVLQIFHQLCAGLKHMHSFDHPYAHNDVKPGNVLITEKKGKPPVAILMDFGSSTPARKQIRSHSEALQLEEWAAKNCSAHFRAPELWKCPSNVDIDERTDIWSLGCTLYALMYGVSPFEYETFETEEELKLAVTSGKIKWPPGPEVPYPDTLRQFVNWMLQPQPSIRPTIDDVIIHVDKLMSKFKY